MQSTLPCYEASLASNFIGPATSELKLEHDAGLSSLSFRQNLLQDVAALDKLESASGDDMLCHIMQA